MKKMLYYYILYTVNTVGVFVVRVFSFVELFSISSHKIAQQEKKQHHDCSR